VLPALTVSGCGALPDAKPFAEASHTLATSVASAGQAVVDSLGEAGALTESDMPPTRTAPTDSAPLGASGWQPPVRWLRIPRRSAI